MATFHDKGHVSLPMNERFNDPVFNIKIFEISFRAQSDPHTQILTYMMPYFSRAFELPCNGNISEFFSSDIFTTGKFPPGSDVIIFDPTTPPKRRSKLSIHDKKDTSYIIFKIDDGVNCRFSTSFAPFSIAEEPSTDDLTTIFMEATFLYPSSTNNIEIAKDTEQDLGTYSETKWAYFVYNGAAVTQNEYAYSFNVNVEFFDAKSDDIIPITIDPDVGHPGGGSSV